MNKENLIKKISKDSKIKKKNCHKIFGKVIELITKDLKKGESVLLEGFGEFRIIRDEMKILIKKDRNKIVIPPKDLITFIPGDGRAGSQTAGDKIKSAVSIEFGMSKKKAGNAVEAILTGLSGQLAKGKNIELQKFGKMIVSVKKGDTSGNKIISFVPSKKLAKRVNNNFENLKKVKMKTGELNLNIEDIPEMNEREDKLILTKSEDKFEFKISEDFKKEIQKDIGEPEIIIEDKEPAFANPKKLISENLVKLHKEIIQENKDASDEETNLWG